VEDFRLLPPNKERRKSQYMIIGTFLSKKDGSTVRTMNVEIGVSCELLNTIEEGTYDAIDRAHADEVSVEKILKLKKTIYTMNDDYNRIKDPISAVHGGFGNDFWGRFLKFFVYDYELVFAQEQYLRLMASVTNTDATTLLATYRPKNIISRAYFKLHEILNTTHGNDDKTLISRLPNNPNILSIGEAPGGFIQCILHHLKESASLNLYGISITTANAHVSSTWGKLISLLEEEDGHYNITTKYGGQPNESNQNVTLIDADLTVDATLTDLLNSLGLPEPRNHDDNDDNDDDDDEGSPVNAGGKGMDLITADGYVIPDNLDYEEMSMYTLLFTETVYALLTQARGGSFVIKLYDIFTDFTVKLITYISQYYDKVYLTKPMSSRIANSEKYLVCTGFRGFPTEKRQQILKVWRKFMDVENSTDKSVEIGKQQHIIDVFDTVEEYEADSISLYNNVYLNEQIQAFLFAGEQFKAYITSDKDQLENRLSSRFKNQMEHYEQWRKDFNYHPHQHQ
jgi:23S rRNA U2552 (ribose-2'-O)-methylase RlmE/FtsJ